MLRPLCLQSGPLIGIVGLLDLCVQIFACLARLELTVLCNNDVRETVSPYGVESRNRDEILLLVSRPQSSDVHLSQEFIPDPLLPVERDPYFRSGGIVFSSFIEVEF